MHGFSRFVEELNSTETLNVQNCVNPIENIVHQMYELSGFAEKLKIQN